MTDMNPHSGKPLMLPGIARHDPMTLTREPDVTSETNPTDTVDVFSLPVHPWAARFPMRSDDDLDAMAESIKAHGLRMPVVLGMAIPSDGTVPTLCVIDGRNRIAGCERL